MQVLHKNRLFIAVFILLVIANIGLLISIWLHRPAAYAAFNKAGSIDAYIIKELALDEQQQAGYRVLIEEHRAQTHALREAINRDKAALFQLLPTDSAATIAVQKATAKLGQDEADFQLVTFRHFSKLRAICTPEQQAQLDGVIQDVLHRMEPQQQGPPPPMQGKPPMGEEPPPPR